MLYETQEWKGVLEWTTPGLVRFRMQFTQFAGSAHGQLRVQWYNRDNEEWETNHRWNTNHSVETKE